MGLQLSISAKEEKKSIFLFECTGSYSFDNKGGYGGLNPKVTDAVEAYVEVQTPSMNDGDELIKINLYPNFPTSTEVGFEILPTQLGMKNEIESGRYKFKYTVVTQDKNGVKTTKTAYFVLFCMNSVTCCIDKRIKEIRAGGSNDPKQKLLIELSNLLESVKYQIDCGNLGTANEDVDYLKSQCKCCGCS